MLLLFPFKTIPIGEDPSNKTSDIIQLLESTSMKFDPNKVDRLLQIILLATVFPLPLITKDFLTDRLNMTLLNCKSLATSIFASSKPSVNSQFSMIALPTLTFNTLTLLT